MRGLSARKDETRLHHVTVERKGAILVVRGVPARVCENCGEEYREERDAARLDELADEAAKPGVEVEIRDYRAA